MNMDSQQRPEWKPELGDPAHRGMVRILGWNLLLPLLVLPALGYGSGGDIFQRLEVNILAGLFLGLVLLIINVNLAVRTSTNGHPDHTAYVLGAIIAPFAIFGGCLAGVGL